MQIERSRRRSMGFLDRGDETWSCFLVTYGGDDGQWRGYFSFRPQDGDADEDEIRTADIFMEDSEPEIDRKARGLGRPLLSGLLSSALHTRERFEESPPHLRKWFRSLVQGHSRELAGRWEEDGSSAEERSLAELRSIYASYRLDQVAHFITLIRSEDFHDAVDHMLAGRTFDFSAQDRLQFAMMVVEFIEARLPLPPFEVWTRDYLANPEAYRLYTHTLHRTGRLP